MINYIKISRFNIFLITLFSIYLVFTIKTVISHYLAGSFQYYDLGLISDFLFHSFSKRGLFYIPISNSSHLALHFTPTLFFYSPLYALFPHYNLLNIINVFLLFTSILFAYKLFIIFISKVPHSTNIKNLSILLFLLIISFNRFFKANIFSAHYEVLYLTLSVIYLYCFFKNIKTQYLFTITLLILGVREDAGIYFFFLNLSLLFIPKKFQYNINNYKYKIILPCLFSLIYVLITILLIMPEMKEMYGVKDNNLILRFWGRWGQSPREIVFNMLTSPYQILLSVKASAFIEFVRTHFYIMLLRPIEFFIINIPGIIFYTSNDPYKSGLFFYQTSFILAGNWLCIMISLLIVLDKFKQKRSTVYLLTAFLLLCLTFQIKDFKNSKAFIDFWPKNDQVTYFENIKRDIEDTLSSNSFESVAVSRNLYVLMKPSQKKYLLNEFNSAELVILENKSLSYTSLKKFSKIKTWTNNGFPGFEILRRTDELLFIKRKK